MKRPLRKTSISRSITRRCSLLPRKISALNHVKSASPIPTLLRHKTLPHTTIPRKTIPPAAAMIALARILAAVPTEEETVAGIAAGVAVARGGGRPAAAPPPPSHPARPAAPCGTGAGRGAGLVGFT